MSIILNKISKIYDTQRAVDEVSFEVHSGEIVGLLGPNGAGKSTLMKMISCFIPPTSGTAKVAGYDIYEHPLEIKKKIGYLPESNPLYYDMYIKEALQFTAKVHRIENIQQKIKEVIEITGLGPEIHKKIGMLSKGYKQRVGLAQALITDPEILILDEPTSGLDPNQLVEIRSLIKESGKQKTVLLSTHIMQEVEAICNRIIIINKGKIVTDIPTAGLSSLQKNNQSILVRFDKPTDKYKILTLYNIATCENVGKNTYKLTSLSPEKAKEELFEFAVQNQLKIVSLSDENSKLEDIFRELTSG